jgi:hypothetical protein
MVRRPSKAGTKKAAQAHPAGKRFCGIRLGPPIVLPEGIDPRRASAIVLLKNKWVNGTLLQYHFMDDWPAADPQKEIVRQAFAQWKNIGIGLDFEEVAAQEEAEIRVGFADDGSWSYVGTDTLTAPVDEQTMNFGWDLTTSWGKATALHEIGHAIGLPHEHQNPKAGIVWDEDKVYEVFAQTQGWSHDQIYHNVIRKIPISDVQGTTWDPTSIMHYPFEAGLIKAPKPYDKGTPENVKLSQADIDFVRTLYPKSPSAAVALQPMQVHSLRMESGQQADFVIEPTMTRYHRMETVGQSDSKMVLFEVREGKPRYLTADDDSGIDKNAQIRYRLVRGKRYLLRVRLHHSGGADGFGVLMV